MQNDNKKMIRRTNPLIPFIFRKSENVVSGLTTAAGLWVTAALGLACGGGMYILAIASTILVLVGLEAFNFVLRKIDKPSRKQ